MNKKELESAYQRRVYFLSNSGIYIKIGVVNEEIDQILEEYGVTEWAFITPWNPGGKPLSRNENLKRQSEMLDSIHDFVFMEGTEEDRETGETEDGLFILGINLQKARDIGRAFGQTAILHGSKGKIASLIIL